MIQNARETSPRESARLETAAHGGLPWLLLLLAGSGCAALIYEIIWFQLLQLVIGSSGVSLGLLLAAYMGGLCLGSALLPHLVSTRHHPLRVYALLEAGIGLFGILALYGVPLVGRLYVAGASEGMIGLVLRGLVAGACLLPPTLLMGGSLPAIARWTEANPRGVSWLGYLYSANIAGAVLGCVVAGFYLLREHDMTVATYAAAGVNAAVAGLALFLTARWRAVPVAQTSAPQRAQRAPGALLVYAVIGLSGLTALGAEVVWTRLLSLLLGATVYTFSIILAVFLIGLWVGSSAGSWLARRSALPRTMLAVCQILLGATIAWTAYTLAHSLPYWPVDPWLSVNPWFNFELDLARCTWAIFPATVLWGASFPLALAAAAAPGEDPGRLSGEVYAVNTAGSIVGSLAFSLVLIPGLGTAGSQQLLIAVSGASALVAALSLRGISGSRPVAVAAAAVAALLLLFTVSDVPWQMVAYGRRFAPIVRAEDLFDRGNPSTVLFRGEGVNSSVVITERAGQRHFYVSGKAEASTAPLDMRLERMMGHLPALVNPQPRSVLIVGFGAGVTAGSFIPYPDVRHITICELEPLIPPASTQFFGKQNNWVANDRRTRIVYDDARHYIFTTRDKFDVITTDPIHPWVKGTYTLYSKQYYELVKAHLNPGGAVAQWLPIYDSDLETVKTELATFFDVFPEGTVWSNNFNGDGYDLVLLGTTAPTTVSVDDLQHRLDTPGYLAVSQSLADVGFHSAVDVLATYAGRASDLKPLTADAAINEDLNMRLQYLAGLGLNSMANQTIYRTILKYRRFPDGLLVGTGGRMDALRTLLHSSR
ncbi:MAG TPA: fused MFS/spermidine synthase [Bryobacteraceae bacterium]|nr:fused MFS/spermidine synthase [Bryobacteraceae bacterium]